MLEKLALIPFLISSTTQSLNEANVAGINHHELIPQEQIILNTEINSGIDYSRVFKVEHFDDNGNNLVDIQILSPFIHQVDDLEEGTLASIGVTACGPTSLTMALNQRGGNYKLNEVIDALPGYVYQKQVGFYQLNKGPETFGLKGVEIDWTTESLYSTLENGYPVIMNIQGYEGSIGHAILVLGLKGYNPQTKNAQALIAHDPYGGPYREFKYLGERSLLQPEGYTNTIGTKKPFYIVGDEI